MEIYKLSDFGGVDERSERSHRLTKRKQYGKMESEALESARVFDSGNLLKITDIRPAVKHDSRVNVFINGKYAFSLDVAQAVDLKIKAGQIVTAAELADYKKASEFGKAYQRALEWALMRPRSVQELKDYLWRRERTNELKERQREWQDAKEADGRRREVRHKKQKYDFTETIVTRLVEKGYVDDRKFAEYYVENRFVKKGISAKRLKMELARKGVPGEVVEEVLNGAGRNETEEIKKMIAKKRAKYTDEKLISYLCRQGFDYGTVSELVRASGTD